MTAATSTPDSPHLLPVEGSPYAAVRHFDLSAEPVQISRRQWNPHKVRDPGLLRGIVLHQWESPVGTMAVNRARYGEAEALARRGLATSYTIDAGVARHSGEPVVVLAHPVSRYTHASDSACGEWIAIGVMGRFAYDDERDPSARAYTEETPALILAVGAAIDLAVRLLAGDDNDAGPWALITHRQAVNGRGDHRECPGEAVVRMAMMADAVRRGVIVPDPDMVLVPEWGLPWPSHWRRYLPTSSAPPAAAAPTRKAGSMTPQVVGRAGLPGDLQEFLASGAPVVGD